MSPRLHVATRKGLFCFEKSGSSWGISGTHFVGDPVTMVMHDPRDGTLFAALDHGHFGVKMHRSRDGGQSFEEIGVPEYPPKPEGLEDQDPMMKTPRPWKLKAVWALAAGGARQEGRLWSGTIPGGLFRSNDHGDTWDLVRSLWDHPGRQRWFGGGTDLPALHSICVHPQDADHVLVGVSCGGVWLTRDGGETWACKADGMRAAYMPPDQAHDPGIQDPHCLVQCPAQPDHLWVQHHNGIFRSTDCSESWSEIQDVQPSTFGFATAVHPEDPSQAWFIPAAKDEKRFPIDGKVVVTRTRDGGKSFEILREGLPQEHAYDLVYRHALDIDASGNLLAFGSTTGSLWLTENQGDVWQTLSCNLPPVYAVRFEK